MEQTLLQRLIDESDIRDVIHRYAESIDRRRWEALQTCFADAIEADFTRAGIKEIFRGASQDWIAGMKATNLGMDSTLHQISNVRIQVKGDTATGSSVFHVTNLLANPAGDSHYIVNGFYDYEFRRIGGEWRIARYTGTMHQRMGNTYLFKLAHARGEKLLKQQAQQQQQQA